MNITVKLFSSLMEYLPGDVDGNTLELSFNDDQTPHQIVDRYKVPREEVQMMMLNGVFLPEEQRDETLKDGDTLSVWPTIQGG